MNLGSKLQECGPPTGEVGGGGKAEGAYLCS